MRRTVDCHLAHPVVVCVVLVGVRIEPAVPQAESPFPEAVSGAEIHAKRPGVIHVLILPGPYGVVLDDVLCRRFVVRDSHKCDHVLDTVIVARDVDAQSGECVFPSQREIVAGLRTQAEVAEIEIRAAHLFDVAVVQFLGGRGLEALAPGGAYAPGQAQCKHRGDFRGDLDPELAVPGQARTAGQLEPVTTEIVLPFVLDVKCGGPVADRSADHTGRGIQPVVAVFGAGVQQIVGGQPEDAFQTGHGPALVALHFGLAGQIWIVGIIDRPLALLVIFDQGGGRKIIHIRMPVPVQVERHHVCGVGLPFGSGRCRGVAVLQVVGVYVELGVFSVGTVDPLAVNGTARIEFQFVGSREGELFAHLGVGVTVHGLVLRVRDGSLGARGMFYGCILPAV